MKRKILTVLGAVAALLVVGVGVWLWQYTRPGTPLELMGGIEADRGAVLMNYFDKEGGNNQWGACWLEGQDLEQMEQMLGQLTFTREVRLETLLGGGGNAYPLEESGYDWDIDFRAGEQRLGSLKWIQGNWYYFLPEGGRTTLQAAPGQEETVQEILDFLLQRCEMQPA